MADFNFDGAEATYVARHYIGGRLSEDAAIRMLVSDGAPIDEAEDFLAAERFEAGQP